MKFLPKAALALASTCILAGCGSNTPVNTPLSTSPTGQTAASHAYGVTARGGSSMFVPLPDATALPAVMRNVAMMLLRPNSTSSPAPSGIAMSFNGYCTGGQPSNIFWETGGSGNVAPATPLNILIGMGASNAALPQGCTY